MKPEFSKKLLVIDYSILIVLFCFALFVPSLNLESIIIAWIAQVGISSAAYYWKAKSENRAKIPLKVIESLPADMQEKIDLTEVITTIIQSE